MPRRCVAPGCKSNYESTIKAEGVISTFQFPRNPSVRLKWMQAIKKKGWKLMNSSSICIKHFEPHFIMYTQRTFNAYGELIDVPLHRPILIRGAVPTIFENSKNDPEEFSGDASFITGLEFLLDHTYVKENKIQHGFAEVEANIDLEPQQCVDTVPNFEIFIEQFISRLNLTNWFFKNVKYGIYFYLVGDSHNGNNLQVLCSVFVSVDLFIKVFLGKNELSTNEFKKLFSCDVKLDSWAKFNNLLIEFKQSLNKKIQNKDKMILKDSVANLESDS